MHRFKYSRTKFWIALIVALGLTFMVSGLTWMIFTRLGNPNANTITAITTLVFLAFFSARMALQYFRDEVVLAILPTGIEDLRWSVGLIEWERIKEITLTGVKVNSGLKSICGRRLVFPKNIPIALENLDSDVDKIIAAISAHLPVRNEN